MGTLDIEKAIQKGERDFEPGVLASANRGLLYIDEVNLLDDHVVDLLLDSAAMGVNIVEREGISFTHPSNFILVGTMNPEEGDLRPQLLDRFAFAVDVFGINATRERVAIMQRNIAFEENPIAFYERWLPKEQELANEILTARKLVDQVTYSSRNLLTIATMTASLNVDGHRADLVILKAARAHAAYEGRTAINDMDIAIAAELALPHRVKQKFSKSKDLSAEALHDKITEIEGDEELEGQPRPNSNSDQGTEAEKKDKKNRRQSSTNKF